jgi:hypothetical protein
MIDRSIGDLLGVLCRATTELGRHFPPPESADVHGGKAYRHRPEHRTPELLCYLKAVKLCSTLYGAGALAHNGLPQECYALCRIAEEMGEDILFMIKPRGEDGVLSPLQQRFVQEFYQEEFDNPDPLQATQRRDRVQRRKLQAAILGDGGGVLDPHTALETANTLHKTFSGFVHGAYEHIMDMCGDDPPRYFIDGMQGTPRIEEMRRTLPNYVYRGALSVEAVARICGRRDVVDALVERSQSFAVAWDLINAERQPRTGRAGGVSRSPPS